MVDSELKQIINENNKNINEPMKIFSINFQMRPNKFSIHIVLVVEIHVTVLIMN